MNHMPELVNQRPRGRPPKAKHDNMSDLKQHIIELEELNEPKRRGRPPKLTKPGKPTPDDIAKERKNERDTDKTHYKAEMQKYLKERLHQGKSKLKLDHAIKQLDAKIKAL